MSRKRSEQINDYIQRDPYSRFLGAEIDIVRPGYSRVSLTISEEMTNFHGMTHGGVIFSLGDIAFAAAGNSRGQTAVALNIAINFLRAAKPGDRLVAEALERSESGPTALYDITIKNERTGELVATSQDLVYRKKEWFVPKEDNNEEKK